MSSPSNDACLRCGTTGLEDGYLNDTSGYDHGSYLQWLAGPLEFSWTGAVKKSAQRTRFQVIARRCSACGQLDLRTGPQV